MSRLRDRLKHDPDAPGVSVPSEQAAELRRVAVLFLISSITLALFLLRAFAEALEVTFIPNVAYVIWGIVLLVGWALSWAWGIYVTLKARRWGWFVLCVVPFTCVPGAVVYSWIRRGEMESAVLGDVPTRGRQPRGGRGRRR